MKVLFRQDQDNWEELPIVSEYMDVVTCRTECRDNDLVVGRYSVLPFYSELEKDLEYFGSRLINSYRQHSWIADFDYYEEMRGLTPKTWTDYDFHSAPQGSYVSLEVFAPAHC